MQVSSGVALVITTAYKSGLINFETYCAIKQKYKGIF